MRPPPPPPPCASRWPSPDARARYGPLSGPQATEDVLYLLSGYGVRTGVDAEAVLQAGAFICAALGRPNASRAAVAQLARRRALAEREAAVAAQAAGRSREAGAAQAASAG
jgi:hypothetical protein